MLVPASRLRLRLSRKNSLNDGRFFPIVFFSSSASDDEVSLSSSVEDMTRAVTQRNEEEEEEDMRRSFVDGKGKAGPFTTSPEGWSEGALLHSFGLASSTRLQSQPARHTSLASPHQHQTLPIHLLFTHHVSMRCLAHCAFVVTHYQQR